MPDKNHIDKLRTLRPFQGRHILIIVENLPVPFDRRVWMEARTLKAAGADVTVICPKSEEYPTSEEHLEGIRVLRHYMPEDGNGPWGYLIEYGVALFFEFLLACRVFFKHRFDVIHACNPPDLIFLVALPFRLAGVKFLFDHHDINPELYEAKFEKRGAFWKLMLLLERLTYRCADTAVVTNESYKDIAIGRGGMREDKVFVVRSGPDLSRVKPVPENPGWRNKRSYLVGYVGVMGHQEGIDLLLEAVRHLVYELDRRDIQFVLVGSGPALAELKQLSIQLGLEEYVHFTGRASDEVLLEVLCTADLCVNPDRVNAMNDKSTMNKIMEYMALAKPIVQFELVEGRVSAAGASVYARPNDPVDFAGKIVELLASPEKRQAMGQYGFDRVRTQLNWNESVPPLINAYCSVLRLSATFSSTAGVSRE